MRWLQNSRNGIPTCCLQLTSFNLRKQNSHWHWHSVWNNYHICAYKSVRRDKKKRA
ncbi:hypothetical protein ACHAXM_005949, partial [Skeletonema potamos]